MPAIAELPSTQPVAPVSHFHADYWADAPQAQGIEGTKVFSKAEEVYRHWSERTEALLTPREDEFTYEYVPPNRTFYVKTRYVYVGKGLPQPFDLDDE